MAQRLGGPHLWRRVALIEVHHWHPERRDALASSTHKARLCPLGTVGQEGQAHHHALYVASLQERTNRIDNLLHGRVAECVEWQWHTHVLIEERDAGLPGADVEGEDAHVRKGTARCAKRQVPRLLTREVRSRTAIRPMPLSVAPEIVEQAVAGILARDEAWKAIERIASISTGRLRELMLLDPGRQFKQSFLVHIADGDANVWLVAKAYKRCCPDRFDREVFPRTDPDLAPYAPGYVGCSRRITDSAANMPMTDGDHLVLLEEFVDGTDLLEFRGTPEYAVHRAHCEARYALACCLLVGKAGRTLSNVNPKNIRIPYIATREPVIVDWGGQRAVRDPSEVAFSLA